MRHPILGAAILLATATVPAFAQEPIAEFQTLLSARGCDIGTVDGQWGRRTTTAAEALSAAAAIAIERPITAELIAALEATNAKCPLPPAPPVFLVSEPGTPESYWKAWEKAKSCDSPAAHNASPQERHKKVQLSKTVPENFGWPLSTPKGMELSCDVGFGNLQLAMVRDAAISESSYADVFPSDVFTEALSRGMTRQFKPSGSETIEAASEPIIDFLLRAAEAGALTEDNMVRRGDRPSMDYPVMNAFNASMVAFAAVESHMTADQRTKVYEWLAPMIERILNSTWPGVPDNKATYREVVGAFWGHLTKDPSLVQRAREAYQFNIRYMRPDGTFGRDASRGGSGAHYNAINTADLIMIAALDAMEGGALFNYEADGRSVHEAVKFYLDFAADRSINRKYGRPCEGGSRGTIENPDDYFWRVDRGRGGLSLTAMRVYAAFNPTHANTARWRELLKIQDSSSVVWDDHHGPMMCFVGSRQPAE